MVKSLISGTPWFIWEKIYKEIKLKKWTQNTTLK